MIQKEMHRVNRMCDNDVHRELLPGKALFIDALQDVPVGVKITSLGFEVPCRINIKYIEGGEDASVNIYASLKHKNPTAEENEFSKEGRPKHIIITNPKSDKFENGPMREDMSEFQC